jgi:hypothetical protein
MAGTSSMPPPPPLGGSNSSVGGTVKRKNPPKNAAGQRQDVGWLHCTPLDDKSYKTRCNYCKQEISGGIYRLKHHLAGTTFHVKVCPSVPSDVQQQMWNLVNNLQSKLINKRGMAVAGEEALEIDDAKRKKIVQPGDIFKRGITSQTTINTAFKKKEKEATDLQVATCFYNNAIPFNVIRDEEFIKMCEMVAGFGKGYKLPTYHDIRDKLLKKKVEETHKILEEHKKDWKKFGCTIMTDGWTDQRRRTIINFLVNSPKGTFFLKSIDASAISKTAHKVFQMMDDIVEEVGEENVIQIVTDNAANYKLAGQMLMEKRTKLCWTPCAAHCIDLMLEDFESKIPMHKDTIASGKRITTYIYARTGLITLLHHFTEGGELIRPGITRFATSYLCLGCLKDKRGALVRMFTSKQWNDGPFAKTKDGKLVQNTVLDKNFWKNVILCLWAAFPLLRVLRMVDSDEPAMGLIYEAMDEAKEEIRAGYNNKKKR